MIRALLKAGANPNLKDLNGRTPLHYACNAGNSKAVEVLLHKQKIDLEAKDSFGRTALYVACVNKDANPQVIRQLVKAGADLHATDSDGNSPTTIALRDLNVKALTHLLDCGLDPNMTLENDNTLLMECFTRTLDLKYYEPEEKKIVEIADLLVKRGARINEANKEGKTALMLACRQGSDPCIECLLTNGASVDVRDRDGLTPLMHFCYSPPLHRHIGNKMAQWATEKRSMARNTLFEKLIPSFPERVNHKDSKGRTALFHALQSNKQLIEPLVDAGEELDEPDNDGTTPLLLAIKEKRDEVRTLLFLGADPDKPLKGGQTAREVSKQESAKSEYGHDEVQHWLVDCWKDGSSLLHFVSERADTGVIKRLLLQKDAKEAINRQDQKGLTPLARFFTQFIYIKFFLRDKTNEVTPELIRMLLAAGADINLKDTSGRTVFHLACLTGNSKAVVQLLKSSKPDLRATEHESGQTPLHEVCASKHESYENYESYTIAQELVWAGADRTMKDRSGNTPLMSATKAGNFFDFLVYSTVINEPDNDGNTPLQIALKKKDIGLMEALLRHGADPQVKMEDGKTTFLEYVQRDQSLLKSLHYVLRIRDHIRD